MSSPEKVYSLPLDSQASLLIVDLVGGMKKTLLNHMILFGMYSYYINFSIVTTI
jgi:hypothetical protein